MTCHDYKDLLMGYLDNELSDEQRNRFEEHLAGCPECAGELKEFQKLKAITDEVTLVEPEDRIWQDYWHGIYNRIERSIGWIIFSVAAILLEARPACTYSRAGDIVCLCNTGENLFLEQRPIQECKEIKRCFCPQQIRFMARRL